MRGKWRLVLGLFFLVLGVVLLAWGLWPLGHEVLTQTLPVVVP